jgi:hypothetical protein
LHHHDNILILGDQHFFFISRATGVRTPHVRKPPRTHFLSFLRSFPLYFFFFFFTILCSGTEFDSPFPQSTKYGPNTDQRAPALLEIMKADKGGTNVFAPLQPVSSHALHNVDKRHVFY